MHQESDDINTEDQILLVLSHLNKKMRDMMYMFNGKQIYS